MADQWFYASNGKQAGPVSFEQLRGSASRGGLAATDLVWQEGTPDWRQAGEVAGLFAAATAYGTPAPAQPPPPPAQGVPAQPVAYAAPYQPQYPSYSQGSVPNYLVQAILVTIFCCVPFGIPAIVFAAQVNGKLAAGDYQGAVSASNSAKMWSWLAFGLGGGVIAIYFLLIIIAGVAGA